MRINSIGNNQSFGSIYKIRCYPNDVAKFDQIIATNYKRNGGRILGVEVGKTTTWLKGLFVKNNANSEVKSSKALKDLYVFTNEDCTNFIKKFNEKFYHNQPMISDNKLLQNVFEPAIFVFNKTMSSFFNPNNIENLKDIDELAQKLI